MRRRVAFTLRAGLLLMRLYAAAPVSSIARPMGCAYGLDDAGAFGAARFFVPSAIHRDDGFGPVWSLHAQ